MKRSRRYIIPLVKVNSEVPLVGIEINGHYVTALIDTGSELTVFDKNIKQLFEKDFLSEELDKKINLVGFQGEVNHVLETVETRIVLTDFLENKLYFDATALFSDLTVVSEHFRHVVSNGCEVSAILGSDFLLKYSAKIDYEHSNMTLVK